MTVLLLYLQAFLLSSRVSDREESGCSRHDERSSICDPHRAYDFELKMDESVVFLHCPFQRAVQVFDEQFFFRQSDNAGLHTPAA